MSSKMVLDRVGSMRAVHGSVQQSAETIGAHIAARLRPQLRSGERLPDVALFVELLSRELASQAESMRRADAAHETELADDAGPRAMRDRHAQALREVYTDLRGAMTAAYGPEVLALLRLSDAASPDPAVLAEQGQAAREALLDSAKKLPKPRRAGAKIDREAFAEELSASVVALHKALEQVERERKEADVTLAAKSASLDAYDATFGRIVPALSSLYALAEQDALAAKLRVSRRSRGLLEEEPAAPTPDVPETPAS